MTRKLTFLILALLALIAGPGWGQNTYTKATSLQVGDEVVLVCENANMEMSSISTTSTKYGIGTEFVDSPSGTYTMTVVAGSETGSFSFKNGSNYLRWNSGNSLDAAATSEVKNSSWTISFDGNGNATILNCNDETRQILWNKSSPRFACYAGQSVGNSYYAVQFYKKQSTPTKELVSLAISGTPTKTEYETGEEFDPAGLVVTGTYDDESTADLTNAAEWTFDPATFTSTSQNSVSVTATVDGKSDTKNYSITVSEHVITPGTYEITPNNTFFGIEVQTTGSHGSVTRTQNDITITHSGGSNFYCNESQIRTYKGNTLTFSVPTGYEITCIVLAVTDNASYSANVGTYTVSTKTWAGNANEVILTSGQSSGNYQITKITVTFATNKTVESIAVKTAPVKTTYYVGETFDPAGLEITATYDDESTEDIAYAGHESDFTFSPELTTPLTISNTSVTITYGDKNVSQPITVTEAPKHTVSYHSNGVVTSDQVYAGVIQLTAPTNIPNGYTYVGWTDEPITGIAQTATYFSSYNVTEDVDLYAVFVIATKGGNSYRLSSTAPAAGDNVIVAGKKDDKYYALWVESTATSTELTIANGVVTNYEGLIWSASYDEYNEKYGIVLNNGTNPLHMNSSALKVASSNQNGTFEFPVSGDGFNIYGNQNTRWMTFNGTTFGVTSDETSASTLYFFKPVTYSNYCTTVTDLSGNLVEATTEADNAYYISEEAYVPANATATINGVLGNADASLLIINDGAQLIHHNAGVNATVKKSITGYTDPEGNDGYYLIANPTDNATVAHLTENNYDLYTFDPTQALEWHYEKESNTLTSGIGYLYANSETVTLEFAGKLLPAGSTDVDLVYAEEGAGIDFPGFNLIGNPYACDAYVNGYNFYTMADGEFVINEGSATVAPCEGFFVEAIEANQSVTISTAAPVTVPNALSLNVSQNRGNVIDRAIVNFNGSNNLHKFMMNPAHTNLSIAKGGETFAAISTEAEGELPVNFKAEKNGSYTITVDTENVDAEYLHLIDNMTGMDVDLLSTPSYTFDAKTSDYASRFKLVFGVKNEASESSDSSFAFMSNGNLVIDNIEGEATLQIVDMMGRVVSTETVSGNYCKALNLRAGVYVLNLNGMTQKIVVK